MYLLKEPMIVEVGLKTYLIDCFGMGTAMVFVGEKKALLVDTGSGNSNIKEQLERFIDVPIMCAVTHEHADHIGCIPLFDQVYVPALELEQISRTTGEFMQTFLDYFCDLITVDGSIGVYEPLRKLIPWDRKPELIPLYDGDAFDLGGRTVTVYRCQVHSKGHLVFVDDLTRIMYAGDSLSDNTGVVSNPMNPPTVISLEDQLRGLKNIKAHGSEYDRFYSGHTEWGGNVAAFRSFGRDTIDRMITAAENVLAGKAAVGHEGGSHGSRDYASCGPTLLYFFNEYLHDSDLPPEYRYTDPGQGHHIYS